MVSTLWETTPPQRYGGTERVVSKLTEGLIKKGHDVTLFATGDSKTEAKLKSVYPRALYRDGVPWSDMMWPLINIGKAIEYAQKIRADIIHCHCQYVGYPFGSVSTVPIVYTHHSSLRPEVIGKSNQAMFENFSKNNFISISFDQRKPRPELNWVGNVYNGIDVDSFEIGLMPENYIAWVGRFTPCKGPKEAIEVAKKSGLELRMAAKIEKNNADDFKYYTEEILPLIDGKQIKYIGEVNHEEKNQLLKNALCLINPIKWDEPFGLVPVEANASGCPAIVFNRGAMKEIIKDGTNGVLIEPDNLEDMVKAISKINEIDRQQCRDYVESNFSVSKMVDDYLAIYSKVVKA